MKKLFVLTMTFLMTLACCISFAQQTQVPVVKRPVVYFTNLNNQKQILIVETIQPGSELVREAIKNELEKLPKIKAEAGDLSKAIGGGWQPEVFKFSKTIFSINEIVRNLGESCDAAQVVSYAQLQDLVDANENIEIDISYFSRQAQNCLKR